MEKYLTQIILGLVVALIMVAFAVEINGALSAIVDSIAGGLK